MAEGFMNKVYGWMATGLCMTAAVAYYLSPAVNPELFKAVSSSFWIFGLAQFALVMYFSFAWRSLSYTSLASIFLIYSGLMGVVLSPLAYIYTGESIFQVFLLAATMFGAMAVYGSVTKSDLSSMGNILMMGLLGLVLANLVNMFVKSVQFDLVIASIGVGVFSLLTAYDVQMLKTFGSQAVGSEEELDKFALLGALNLYLNIINLVLYLLRLFGKKRD